MPEQPDLRAVLLQMAELQATVLRLLAGGGGTDRPIHEPPASIHDEPKVAKVPHVPTSPTSAGLTQMDQALNCLFRGLAIIDAQGWTWQIEGPALCLLWGTTEHVGESNCCPYPVGVGENPETDVGLRWRIEWMLQHAQKPWRLNQPQNRTSVYRDLREQARLQARLQREAEVRQQENERRERMLQQAAAELRRRHGF